VDLELREAKVIKVAGAKQQLAAASAK